MAEMLTGSEGAHHGKKRGGVRAKKLSTRVDMTPMVDLAFLLVTFFILTTTMSKPKAMQVVMPEKDVKDTAQMSKIRESESMTILLGGNDRVYYYFGIENPKVEVTNFTNIRKVIQQRNREVLALQQANGWKPNGVYIGIKPTDKSRYQNLVDMLDEMKINDIKSYAIVDPTPEELAMLPE
ncbi:MAG: biopolymer transporter ExbD [Chitinophagales bacterium]|nr:biopolymer transporter ExbD [Chitinophagales bacterium]MDW8428401.1 biopolymer transporter ExbD [Chitinophagales bacterium]